MTEPILPEPATRRSRQRARPPRDRHAAAIERQLPWRQLRNPYKPFEILSADEIEAIHGASLDILEQVGVAIQSPHVRELCRRHGAEPIGDGVWLRFDRGLTLETIAAAPASFELASRNPRRNVRLGDGYLCFTPVSGAPNVSDLERGRRPGSFADYCDLVKLAHVFNAIHIVGGYPVEPIDLPVPIRHLDAGRAMLTLTDKISRVHCHTAERARDLLEMTRLAHGCTLEGFQAKPRAIAIINTNSPLQLDAAMGEGIVEMAQANQACVITPFTLAGAMAPVTLAGALAQQNAEALSAIAVSQFARRGAPVVYGAFTTNVNMRTGAPAFGTPEYAKAALISGQLARRYRLPFRSSNINTSNAPDAQSAYESMMATWAAITGGVNLLHQSAGWLEGGLTASFEKFVLDIEILQMFAAFLEPLVIDKKALAVATVAEVGPGGHFFAAPHTLARYEHAFHAPLVSDWRNFDAWNADGATDATQRASLIAKEALATYQAPPDRPRQSRGARRLRRQAQGGRRGSRQLS
jgi:trimethylamine--corrinoid protein Co-methyltransferase